MDDNKPPSYPRRRNIDGIIRRPRQDSAARVPERTLDSQRSIPPRRQVTDITVPRQTPPQPRIEQPAPQPAEKAKENPPKKKARFSGLKNIALFLGIVIAAIAVGTALSDVRVGQWLVAVAGISALVVKANSRVVFGTALFCLVMVPILSVVNQKGISENYAIYAFIFLIFGTIRAMIEAAATRPEKT